MAPLQSIPDMEIDLRTVKRTVPLIDPVFDAGLIQHVLQRGFGFFPQFVRTH